MTTPLPSETGRVVRFTMIGLLAFSVLQVCWWLVDQSHYAAGTTNMVRALYSADLMAARRLQVAGVPADEISGYFPHVVPDTEGRLMIAPAATDQLEADRGAHVTQYTWESGFFLLVLAGSIGVLWRGLREEREVRRQQDNFLALVSHQFKTPLASLRLSAETLVKRQPPPDYTRQLSKRMIEDVVRLERMVTKILDSARLERGRVEFQKTRFDLADTAAQIVAQLEETARERGVKLINRLTTPIEIDADSIAVDTVLRNLLENAIAASAENKGEVTLSAAPVADGIAVTVSDTGVGFVPSDARRLFEKFHRLDTGDRQSHGGTGLGLFIVARIMHFEKGRAEAYSGGPGQGATFTVTWPVTTGAAHP